LDKQKRYRQGQILKLIANEAISSQHDLRRRLAQLRLRVTQATLSRDLHELKLVKTSGGYKPLAGPAAEENPEQQLSRALREFLQDIRPAQNLLVLRTPPGGAQPLAAAVDRQNWKEIAGTIAGDDTILLIFSTTKIRAAVEQRIRDLMR
jgi:transcriptional regulator of arginine metabolism